MYQGRHYVYSAMKCHQKRPSMFSSKHYEYCKISVIISGLQNKTRTILSIDHISSIRTPLLGTHRTTSILQIKNDKRWTVIIELTFTQLNLILKWTNQCLRQKLREFIKHTSVFIHFQVY